MRDTDILRFPPGTLLDYQYSFLKYPYITIDADSHRLLVTAMSSDRRPNKIASILRLPLVSKNLAGTLRQPTYMAIAASLGLHGVVGVGFALVSPNGLGDSPLATRMVETNLVELTPEEISRLPVVSTLPVGRLPSANSNALSAGTLPSLSGLPPSSSGNSGNSGLGLPPGPPPPLGASEPTYGAGSFFSSGDGGYSAYSGYTYNSGLDYDSSYDDSQDYLSTEELQALIDLQAALVGGYGSGHNNDPTTDDLELNRKKINLQDEDDRKKLPNEDSNDLVDGEEIVNENEPILANSPEVAEGEIRVVRGIRLPMAFSQELEGQIPVQVVVDEQGIPLDLRFPDGSQNQILELVLLPSIQGILFPSTGSEAVYPVVVLFDENSPTLNEAGSAKQPQTNFEDLQLQALEPDEATDVEPQILTLEPIFYPAADLSISPEEVPETATIEIVVTPEGGMEPQLVASTGDEFLDVIVLDRALAWAIEQKLDLNTPNTHQVTIPLELDVKLDDSSDTSPETATPEPTEETIEDKPIPPQTPAPEPLEPEVVDPEVVEPEVVEPEVVEPEVVEPEVPEPEPPQEKIPPASPTPTLREKRPPQAPSEPESRSEGLPQLPPEEPARSSPPEAPLLIEKEPLSNSSKATKIKP